jgi:hypothetical protein
LTNLERRKYPAPNKTAATAPKIIIPKNDDNSFAYRSERIIRFSILEDINPTIIIPVACRIFVLFLPFTFEKSKEEKIELR